MLESGNATSLCGCCIVADDADGALYTVWAVLLDLQYRSFFIFNSIYKFCIRQKIQPPEDNSCDSRRSYSGSCCDIRCIKEEKIKSRR